jgi:hypothetical protein
MTFPIDFDEHPKVEPLSDGAFRAFVSMNGYSRRQRLDGNIPKAIAVRRWKPRFLAELVASHPERPLVLLDGDTYVIRDYAEHQFTTTDEAELKKKRAEAGSMGGKATASARASATAKPEQTGSKPVAESESGILTDVTNDIESSHLPDSAGEGHDNKARIAASGMGIRDIHKVTEGFVRATKLPMTLGGGVALARAITSKSPNPISNVDAYLSKACRSTPDEVLQAYEDLDIGAFL